MGPQQQQDAVVNSKRGGTRPIRRYGLPGSGKTVPDFAKPECCAFRRLRVFYGGLGPALFAGYARADPTGQESVGWGKSELMPIFGDSDPAPARVCRAAVAPLPSDWFACRWPAPQLEYGAAVAAQDCVQVQE